MAQEPASAFGAVHDVAARVENDARRRILFEHTLVDVGIGNFLAVLGQRKGRGQHRHWCFHKLHGRAQGARHILAAIDTVLLVDRHKQRRAHIGRFRVTQKQVAIGFEGKMESLQQRRLGFAVEIDEQVAAADQVQLGKRRVGQQVVLGEQHTFSYLLAHLVHTLTRDEVLLDTLVADIGNDTDRVDTPAPDIQGMLIDIGGKQLQVDLVFFLLHTL
ncbi:hypothetical protein D3C76_832410 [compost metagenome]